jgi:hypothetical protein
VKILCANCRSFLYTFAGKFEGKIRSKDFKPATGVPSPKMEMVCPVCSSPFYLTTKKGKLIVLTDKGLMPSSPGSKKIALAVETPNSEKLGSEYIDPAERIRRAQGNG